MNKVLIVDDEEAIQILYGDELTDEGYEVVTTGDGSKLLALIAETKPDLIVLDIKLGKYNGLDLLQDIRNRYYNMPVILCTGYPAFKHKPKSMAADYYVVKNSDLSELKLKIKMALDAGIHMPSTTANERFNQERTLPMEQMSIQW
jgi:two-component system response regulator (stage 0 sporulation protein F)